MNKPIGASRRTLKDHDEQRLLRDRPPHFYKYKSIDDDNLKHSSCIFTDNELYFCTANDFNDPFDCEFQVEFSGSKIEAAEYSAYLQEKHGSPLSRKDRRLAIREDIRNLKRPDFANKVRDGFRQSIETWGICCFSEQRDNILMWSHYANAHRGFCLEFSGALHVVDVERTKRRVLPFPVEYSKRYPVANLMQTHGMTETILTKAEQWNYEKEWRITIPGRTGLHPFPPQCLTGVIFGCEMSEKHKDMIYRWCKDQQSTIRYYQARQSTDSYQLHIDELS